MSEIVIAEIQIIPVKPKDGLVAFASCVINNQFYLGNIAIYTSLSSPDGFRLVYPSRMLTNGKHIAITYPINKKTGFTIQKRIVEEYLKIVEGLAKGVDSHGRKSGCD
ncbi:septation protein SpoVG family protein [Patescibacteria group bacterium]|nr:septation protein SpoVG family protein [Patescibacteria group bacterium]